MVGQYQGPDDTAALAVVAPIWNIIYSLGLLTGTGGSVLFSAQRGGHQESGSENQYFTAAVSGSVLLAALAWVGLLLFQGTLLTFFGADESLLPLAEIYMKPIRYVFPLSSSTSCWRPSSATTERRGWRRWVCWPAAC